MSIKYDYYMSKFEELKVLSKKDKSKITLIRNVDTGEIAIKREMVAEAAAIYEKLKGVKSDNIAQVYESFVIDGKCIVIEEFVNGERLDAIIAKGKYIAYHCVNLAIQLCNGLSLVHKAGIIHRDITPKNIIINGEGRLKLIDFDIARETKEDAKQDTTILGTAGYAAPEQFGFSQTGPQSDIYSVGVLLRAMITGSENGNIEAERSRIAGEKVSPNIDMLISIINKCTEMDSKNRYQTTEALACELRKCIGKEVVVAENELPKVTLKYVIRTIPGFKKGNIIFELFAASIYGLFIWAFAAAGWDSTQGVFMKIYSAIMYEIMFIIPYIYLVNIGQIAERFPKIKFKSNAARRGYQILVAFMLMFIIAVIMALTIPIQEPTV